MISVKVGRALTAVGVTAAAILGPIAMAAPASALYSGCLNYVKARGYVVGPKVYNACSHEAWSTGIGIWVANPTCVSKLTALRVEGLTSMEACKRAHG